MTDPKKLSAEYQVARAQLYKMGLHELCRLMWDIHNRIEPEIKILDRGGSGVQADCGKFIAFLDEVKWRIHEIAFTLDGWFSPVSQPGMNTGEGESPESSVPDSSGGSEFKSQLEK